MATQLEKARSQRQVVSASLVEKANPKEGSSSSGISFGDGQPSLQRGDMKVPALGKPCPGTKWRTQEPDYETGICYKTDGVCSIDALFCTESQLKMVRQIGRIFRDAQEMVWKMIVLWEPHRTGDLLLKYLLFDKLAQKKNTMD